jgi:hypothetical protein
VRARDADLAERLVALARALRSRGAASYAPLARAAGLPLAEVLASPFALRIVALAVDRGATTLHGELRRAIAWPRALAGEDGTVDPDHGTWSAGVLHLGKYQQFLQDEPFATYHPQHVSKWGPHELLHRACGFFLRPGETRWETYCGARLGELLPVVTWYAYEQAMRLDDEAGFDREAAGRAPAARLERARWLDEDGRALRARALRAAPLLREGVQHFERELAAIDEEIETGRRVRVQHPFLDASQDALAYVAGHRARLEKTGRSISELVPADGVHRFDDVRAFRESLETLLDAILFSPIRVDLDAAAPRRSARALWDLAHRALQVGGAAARKIAPAAGEAIAAALRGDETIDPEPWRARIADVLGESADAALENGDEDGLALGQLSDGLASAAPRTREIAADSAVRTFATSDAILDRAPLAQRFSRHLAATGERELAALADLEDRLVRATRVDDRVERLCEPVAELPADLEGVLVVKSSAFDLVRYDRDVAALHGGGAAKRGAHTYAIGRVGGEVVVVPVTEHVAKVLDATQGPIAAGELAAALGGLRLARDGDAWLRGLLDAGVLGWTRRL